VIREANVSPGWCVRSRFEGPVVQTGRWWRLLWLCSEAARPGGLVLLLIRGRVIEAFSIQAIGGRKI